MAAWKISEPRIKIECRQQPFERIAVAQVIGVNGFAVTFRELDTSEEWTMDFRGAEIRHHIFEPIEAVRAFAAIWEETDDLGLPRSLTCAITELRDFGEPS